MTQTLDRSVPAKRQKMVHCGDQAFSESDFPIFSEQPDVAPERFKDLVESTVAQVFTIEPTELRGPSRGMARVALARQTAMYLVHCVCCVPVGEVGRVFGRDRTTVRHACAVIEDRRDDPRFDRILHLLEEIVLRMAGVSGLIRSQAMRGSHE